jgi:short-subunit dehydrogenase
MLDREYIWIIGASEGIGAELAHAWAKCGARLVLSARSSTRLQELAATLGADHIVVPLDLADRASIDAAAAQIAKLGPIDRVINMAALYAPGKVAELSPVDVAQNSIRQSDR